MQIRTYKEVSLKGSIWTVSGVECIGSTVDCQFDVLMISVTVRRGDTHVVETAQDVVYHLSFVPA